jgi:hypothetical protein
MQDDSEEFAQAGCEVIDAKRIITVLKALYDGCEQFPLEEG